MSVELLPRHYQWLQTLLGKTHYGNSVEEIALNLLNDRFKQLLEQGELAGETLAPTAIPFPNSDSNPPRIQKDQAS